MSHYARISSVGQLRDLRAALAKFSSTAAEALDEVASDIQRTLTWLSEDRRRYWQTQVRLCNEQFVRAKSVLKRKQIFDRALAGTTSSCVDEKKALKVAQERLAQAQRKLARTHSWIQRIEKDVSDYKAAVAALVSAVDADIPNARAALDKMVDSLEAYIAERPPETPADWVAAEQDKPVRPVNEMPTNLEETIETLRRMTPPEQVRRETPIHPYSAPWLSEIAFSDALGQAARSDPTRQAGPGGPEKVLVARLEDRPSVVYLERTVANEGDSGWYLGAADGSTSDNYAAIAISELLRACPSVEEVLGLPAGTLILADSQKSTEVMVDADDNILWQTARESNESES